MGRAMINVYILGVILIIVCACASFGQSTEEMITEMRWHMSMYNSYCAGNNDAAKYKHLRKAKKLGLKIDQAKSEVITHIVR